jgi:hypothetical protein
MQYDPGFRIDGDGVIPASNRAWGILAVMAVQRQEIWRPLNHPHQPWANTQSMLLLAGNFARVAAAAVDFIDP